MKKTKKSYDYGFVVKPDYVVTSTDQFVVVDKNTIKNREQ